MMINNRGSGLAPSSAALLKSLPTQLPQISSSAAPHRTAVELRRQLYTEATEFSRTSAHNLFGLVMSISNPTDPTASITKPDYDVDWQPDPPHPDQPHRAHWSSLAALLFVLVCDDMTACVVTAPVASAFSKKGAGLYIMCAIIWFCVGVPLLQFNHTMAQFFQGGPLRTFSLLHPRAGGIGISIVIVALIGSFRVLRVLGEALIYAFGSLQPTLPWILDREKIDTCFSFMRDHEGCITSQFCLDFYSNGTCYAAPIGSALAFYEERIIHSVAPDPVSINVGITISILIAILCSAVILIFGLRLLSQLATFTVLCTLSFLVYLGTMAFNRVGGAPAMAIFFAQIHLMDFLSLSNWIGAAVLVLRMGILVSGVQTVMTSYTRIGQNVLPLAWAAAIVFLLLSFFSVLVVYAVEGMLYADNVTRGLTAAFAPDGGKVDPAILRNAIKELLRGREFLETIESYLAVDDAKSLLFILYPWGIAQSQASAIISLVFFLCMALMSLVSFSCSVLIVVSALQETVRFEKTSNTKLVLSVLSCIYLASIPTFMNYTINDTVVQGRELVTITALSLCHFGAPIILAAEIIAACMVLGWKRQHEVFSIYAGPAIFISLTIGIGSGVTAAEVTTGWVSYAIPAILFLLFFLVIPILLSTTGQSFFFKDNLMTLIIGDAEAVRETINGILVAHCQSYYGWRLPCLWSWCFKYGVFIVFVSIMPGVPLSAAGLAPAGLKEEIRNPFADSVVSLFAAVPILVGLLFPSVRVVETFGGRFSLRS